MGTAFDNPAVRELASGMTNVSEETRALFNKSIEGRPLYVPIAGQIAKRLNSEVEFFWARDLCGQNPNHSRVEQLRSAGFEYATTADVEMCSADTVVAENEIRNGDRRLMKVPKRIWLSARKAQNEDAIRMAFPAGNVADDNGKTMTASSLMPGLASQVLSDQEAEPYRARAVESNATEELVTGDIRGNATRVKVKGA